MEKPAKGTPEPTPPAPRWDRMTHEFGEAMREYTLSKRVRAGGGTLKKENDESYQFRYKTLIGEGQFMEAPRSTTARSRSKHGKTSETLSVFDVIRL